MIVASLLGGVAAAGLLVWRAEYQPPISVSAPIDWSNCVTISNFDDELGHHHTMRCAPSGVAPEAR